MIAEAIEKIIGLKKPETIKVDEKTYFDNNYSPAKLQWCDPLKINNLNGIVDYIKNNVDGVVPECFIHVEEYNSVKLVSPVKGDFNQRFTLVQAKARETDFNFGSKYDIERFIIGLHSQFEASDYRNYLLSIVSKLNVESSKSLKDNGIAQEVTIRRGASSMVTSEQIKNPVILRPYRTFHEVEYQPASQFVFRLSETDGAPMCSLHECDGQFWKQDAIRLIGEFFREHVEINVIA